MKFSAPKLCDARQWFLREKMPPGWGWDELAGLVECAEDLKLRLEEAIGHVAELEAELAAFEEEEP